MLPAITRIAVGLGLIGLAAVVARPAAGKAKTRYSRKPKSNATNGETVPWVRDAIDDDGDIRTTFKGAGWFTVTDVARALQGRGDDHKPSGSANRDARLLVNRWASQGLLERRGGHLRGNRRYRLKLRS